jgi:hypothetical protein
LAWFNVKRALRIPTRSDHKFLLQEFGRKLEEGRIGAQCHITVTGGHDGAGAQGLARMSGLCLARKYRLTYVHTPFEHMQHAEGAQATDIYTPNKAWAATWERVFNLGHGEISAADCALPRVEIQDFMADRRWWSTPCLLSAGYFNNIVDRRPDDYLAVIPQLREKYYLRQKPRHRSHVVEVCAHLRRGPDFRHDNPETAHRYVDNSFVTKSISITQAVLKELGLHSRVRLFSLGDEKDFSSLERLGVELCLNTPTVPTFRELVEADVLVMAKSSFSYAAAILNDGVKLYDECARAPMSEWIAMESDGGFDRETLRTRLITRKTS